MATPENVSPFVEVLGIDQTVDFLLAFGGTPVYLAPRPQGRSAVAKLLGHELAAELGRQLGPGHVKIPTAKPWVAAQLSARGMSGIAIARLLHTDERTISRWLNARPSSQMDLFRAS